LHFTLWLSDLITRKRDDRYCRLSGEGSAMERADDLSLLLLLAVAAMIVFVLFIGLTP
jgi:hypothetical protein